LINGQQASQRQPGEKSNDTGLYLTDLVSTLIDVNVIYEHPL